MCSSEMEEIWKPRSPRWLTFFSIWNWCQARHCKNLPAFPCVTRFSNLQNVIAVLHSTLISTLPCFIPTMGSLPKTYILSGHWGGGEETWKGKKAWKYIEKNLIFVYMYICIIICSSLGKKGERPCTLLECKFF